METESIKDRIKSLRKNKRLTQEAFGKKVGLSDVSISLIESGKNAVTETVLKLICLIFGVREEWLRNGKGEPYSKEENAIEILLSIYRSLSPSGKQDVYEFAEFRLQKEEQAARVEKQAPVAGLPLEPLPAGDYEEDRFVG